ncbi:MAG: SPFH domain-containing protein [Phycisphaeraceae bacterium]|nr:SPFH domain-containing protein [Phycisphaeraceae bacterium]
MSIWERLKGELIDIVQWIDDTNDTIVHRFDRRNNEIKYNAKLVVREGQAAVFINEGQLADEFAPGTHTLQTKNLPILSTLKGWKYGFESPFKAEVYFVSTRQFTDLKWGTMNPIIVRDPEFGPVRIRAFGTYTMRVTQPGKFIKEIVGTDGRFTTEEIVNQLRNLIVSEFADIVARSRIPILDMAANQSQLAQFVAERMKIDFEKFGLDIPRLLIENISMPSEVEAALDKRTSMGVIGNLDAYTKMQAADAMRDAAQNSGTAGSMMGFGVGAGMAGMMGSVVGGSIGQAGGGGGGPGTPPPVPGGGVGGAPFFLAVDGRQHGPFEAGLLVNKIRSGELRAETLVWRNGMAQWLPAGQVPELSAVFAQAAAEGPGAPPPIPGA